MNVDVPVKAGAERAAEYLEEESWVFHDAYRRNLVPSMGAHESFRCESHTQADCL